MAEALKEAYGDIFLIKANPTSADAKAIEGKFKSFHNTSDNVATNMRRTFFSLLDLADLTAKKVKNNPKQVDVQTANPGTNNNIQNAQASPALHYNIQVHLPATKDVEVYNAIFKSLKEHLF